ncbi:hypothetical protein DV735_g825, partial [Chaetothyriales sp. CBS 134920]
MGFWNDGTRSPSPARRRSYSSRNGSYNQPSYSTSASSIYGAGGGNNDKVYSSSRSNGRGYSSRPRPRAGFVARIRKFLREVFDYLRRHPVKVFFLVIMPLVTSGALHKLFARIGIHLPRSLGNLVQGFGGAHPGRFFARGGARDREAGTALPGMDGGLGEALGTVAGIAKHFL